MIAAKVSLWLDGVILLSSGYFFRLQAEEKKRSNMIIKVKAELLVAPPLGEPKDVLQPGMGMSSHNI